MLKMLNFLWTAVFDRFILLPPRYSFSRELDRLPNESGSHPSMRFSSRAMNCRLVQFVRPVMMLVLSDIWLKPILYMTRLCSLLRPGGTEPVNRLLDILMLSILVTLWRDGGIGLFQVQ